MVSGRGDGHRPIPRIEVGRCWREFTGKPFFRRKGRKTREEEEKKGRREREGEKVGRSGEKEGGKGRKERRMEVDQNTDGQNRTMTSYVHVY